MLQPSFVVQGAAPADEDDDEGLFRDLRREDFNDEVKGDATCLCLYLDTSVVGIILGGGKLSGEGTRGRGDRCRGCKRGAVVEN